jgi:hypothetical protein
LSARNEQEDKDMAKIIETGSPEHMATFTTQQLRTLAVSADPAHIAYGFAAQCELILRGKS